MTDNNSSSRLDRIELLVEANVKAIEAMRIELRDGITDTITIVTQLAEDAAQEREALRRRQDESDQRFETMLAEMRADRQKADERHESLLQIIRAMLDRDQP